MKIGNLLSLVHNLRARQMNMGGGGCLVV